MLSHNWLLPKTQNGEIVWVCLDACQSFKRFCLSMAAIAHFDCRWQHVMPCTHLGHTISQLPSSSLETGPPMVWVGGCNQGLRSIHEVRARSFLTSCHYLECSCHLLQVGKDIRYTACLRLVSILGRGLAGFTCVSSHNLTFNSLGSEFSSQGHAHSLQLLNVPQFLFCQVVRLKTAPRGHQICDSDYTHQFANT